MSHQARKKCWWSILITGPGQRHAHESQLEIVRWKRSGDLYITLEYRENQVIILSLFEEWGRQFVWNIRANIGKLCKLHPSNIQAIFELLALELSGIRLPCYPFSHRDTSRPCYQTLVLLCSCNSMGVLTWQPHRECCLEPTSTLGKASVSFHMSDEECISFENAIKRPV